MQHSFDYMYTTTALDSLQVNEIGDCAINMINDDYFEYYLLVESNLGNVKIITFGPILVDQNNTDGEFYISKQEFSYNEKRIIKTIQTYLQDGRKNITQAFEIDKETLKNRLKEINIL